MLRRTKADRAAKLPPKIELNISVGLTAMQMKVYQELLQSNSLLDSSNSNSTSYHNLLMQLRKACNHPYNFHGIEEENAGNGEHLATNSGKMIFLEKLLQKCIAQKE